MKKLKLKPIVLTLSLTLLTLIHPLSRTYATAQTTNLLPNSVSNGTSAFSEFYPTQYITDNFIIPMTSHPSAGGNYTFPFRYHLTQDPGGHPNSSQTSVFAGYVGLYGFNTSSICTGATVQSLTAKLNYTAAADSDPGDNFDIAIAIWNGTQRIPGGSNPDINDFSANSAGGSSYEPLNSAHQLDYESSSIPSRTQISNLKVAIWLNQMTQDSFDDLTINSLSLTANYDDSTCTSPTAYCPTPGNTSQLLTPAGDCDGDGITNQTEGYDPDGDGNPNTGTQSIDTDKDGTPDYLDVDTDNDGIPDSTEKGTASDSSTNPADADKNGIQDYRDPNYPKKVSVPHTGRIIGATIASIAIMAGIILTAKEYAKEDKRKTKSTK